MVMSTVKTGKPLPMEEYVQELALMPPDGTPFRYCPGCGLGMAQSAIMRAFKILDLDPDRTLTIGGSGCYAVMGHYFKSSHHHGRHGRACAVATGAKMANPDLTVITLQGDGDCLAIGGNHFIQAARRNVDITVLMFNNFNYGETGGQNGPTTPPWTYTETTPYGMPEGAFDPCKLAIAAGATFVARTTVFHAWQLTRLVVDAISHKGFAFVEILQNCHELWGKRNGMGSATEMLLWFRDNSVQAGAVSRMAPEALAEKFVIGVLHRCERPEMVTEYQKVIDMAQGKQRAGSGR